MADFAGDFMYILNIDEFIIPYMEHKVKKILLIFRKNNKSLWVFFFNIQRIMLLYISAYFA